MFIVGNVAHRLYPASSGWINVDIENVTSDNKTFDYYAIGKLARSFVFKPDGTVLFAVNQMNPDEVDQYTLSTAWDMSTVSFDKSKLLSNGETNPAGLSFNADGTKFFVSGFTNDEISEWSLSTAWDVGTATETTTYDLTDHCTNPRTHWFNDDGTKLAVVSHDDDTIYQYALSTGFDLSTMSYDNKSFDVGAQEGNPWGIVLDPTGTKMWIAGLQQDSILQYSLSTAWDVSTATYDSVMLSGASIGATILGFFTFKPDDATKLYINFSSADEIRQFSVPSL